MDTMPAAFPGIRRSRRRRGNSAFSAGTGLGGGSVDPLVGPDLRQDDRDGNFFGDGRPSGRPFFCPERGVRARRARDLSSEFRLQRVRQSEGAAPVRSRPFALGRSVVQSAGTGRTSRPSGRRCRAPVCPDSGGVTSSRPHGRNHREVRIVTVFLITSGTVRSVVLKSLNSSERSIGTLSIQPESVSVAKNNSTVIWMG